MNETIQQIPLESLLPDPQNRRYGGFNEEKLNELAQSIKEKGVLEPILVRPSPGGSKEGDPQLYEIAAGERRWRAAQIAALTTVPCLVQDLDDHAVLEIRSIENIQREDVHPLDEAESFARLIEAGAYDVKTLAGKIGKSASYIYASLKLRDLVPEAITYLAEGGMTTGHAILIARLQPKDQGAVLKEIKNRLSYMGELSVRALEDLIHRDYFRELALASFKKDDAELLPAAGPCASCPKRTGAQPDLQTSAKEDSCLDPKCFNAKLDAMVKRRLADLAEAGKKEGKDFLQVGDGYNSGGKGLLSSWEWQECKKKDAGAKQVLIAAGPGRGKMTWGKARKGISRGGVPAGETSEQKEKRLREEAKLKEREEVAVLTRRKTLDQVIAAAGKARTRNKKLALEVLRQAAAVLYGHFDDSGFDKDLVTVFWGEELDFKKATVRIAEMSETEVLDLILKLALIEDLEYRYGMGTDALVTAAKTLRLDIKAIEKEARAEIKEKARQAEAQGKQPTSGTCMVCGCTDDQACDDDGEPCHWVNEDNTLCSACEKKKKEPASSEDYLDMIQDSQGDEA